MVVVVVGMELYELFFFFLLSNCTMRARSRNQKGVGVVHRAGWRARMDARAPLDWATVPAPVLRQILFYLGSAGTCPVA